MALEQDTLRQILDLEWEMFHSVQGIDGPAPCQEDRGAFEVMRSSQLLAWDEESAASYLEDLRQARASGRNLMTEKYARMMEYTSPCEFRRIASQLPAVDRDAEPIIEKLTQLSVRWMEELAAKYPYIGAQGRPIRNSGDSVTTPSFETYTRGELATYSTKTLESLRDHFLRMESAGENAAEVILRHTVEKHGYASLEQAEAAQKARREAAER